MARKQELVEGALSVVSKGLSFARGKAASYAAAAPSPAIAPLPEKPETGALLNAALLNDLEKVEDLLARGADKDERAPSGSTPMTYAAIKGYAEIVRALIEHGADVNAVENDGTTVLNWASACGHDGIVRMLLDHGAKADTNSTRGHTPAMFAAHNGSSEIVSSLIDQGVDIEKGDKEGFTARDHAAINGKAETVAVIETALEEKRRIAKEKELIAAQKIAEVSRLAEEARQRRVAGKQAALRRRARAINLK